MTNPRGNPNYYMEEQTRQDEEYISKNRINPEKSSVRGRSASSTSNPVMCQSDRKMITENATVSNYNSSRASFDKINRTVREITENARNIAINLPTHAQHFHNNWEPYLTITEDHRERIEDPCYDIPLNKNYRDHYAHSPMSISL